MSSMDISDIFDPDALPEALGEQDPETLRSFYELFLSHSAQIWHQMQANAAEGRWTEVQTAAHSMKSSCRSIGANALAYSMAELEQATERNRSAEDQLSHTGRVLNTSIESVRQYLDKL